MKSLDLSSENGNQHRIKKKPLSSHSLKTMVENRIGNEGALQFSEALKNNSTLTTLSLERNYLLCLSRKEKTKNN